MTRALSLNDTFWVKRETSPLKWEEVSLYCNPFDEVISQAAFDGSLTSSTFSSTSPEFATDGYYAKCWKREQDGIYLYKAGSATYELEPLSEYLAAQLSSILCPGAVPYDMRFHHGRLVSTCPLFTSESVGLAKMAAIAREDRSISVLLEYFRSIGSEDAFRRMMVLDAIILNTDRHPGNFGVLFDTDTMQVKTMAPVFFRNQPVGCTATIIYQMYQEAGVEVSPVNAALLCAAIISDTLMFRSPTCTPLDETTAKTLAAIAEVDIESLAQEMFNAGSNLKGKSAEEICFLDFKQFTVNDTVFGVGQVNSMSADELKEIKKIVEPHLEKARSAHGLNMIFFMLTNILTESSELLCCGPDAREKLIGAYDLPEDTEELMLKGVVSRKKQLVPALVAALQQ